MSIAAKITAVASGLILALAISPCVAQIRPGQVRRSEFFQQQQGRQAARAQAHPGKHAGEWCPFGRSPDQADDQSEDDARSLVFETMPLGAPIEILGAVSVTLDIMSDDVVRHLGGPALRKHRSVRSRTRTGEAECAVSSRCAATIGAIATRA